MTRLGQLVAAVVLVAALVWLATPAAEGGAGWVATGTVAGLVLGELMRATGRRQEVGE